MNQTSARIWKIELVEPSNVAVSQRAKLFPINYLSLLEYNIWSWISWAVSFFHGLDEDENVKKKDKDTSMEKCEYVTVSVEGLDSGYTVKYTPSTEGVHEGKARGNSWKQRGIFDRISQVKS